MKEIRELQHPRRIAMPIVLIIVPTHELVIEVHQTLLDLCFTSKVRPVAIYGCAPVDAQEKKLQQGRDILIATPGRLIHFLRRNLGKRQTISVEQVEFVVYDEADELELSLEVSDEIWVTLVSIYGGAPVGAQEEKLRPGCDILVATPGRLLYLLRRDLGKRQTVSIYDEADELLRCDNASEVLRYEDSPGSRSFMKEIDEIEKLLHHSH